MSYDGRVLRLAYEVGKTDENYRSMASLASCSAKERLGCHAGYEIMTAGERVVIFVICNFSVPVA